MTSGFGLSGNGRCFAAFKSFEKCMSEEEKSPVCFNLRQDYFDCLHGAPPVARLEPVGIVNVPHRDPYSIFSSMIGLVWQPKTPEGKKATTASD